MGRIGRAREWVDVKRGQVKGAWLYLTDGDFRDYVIRVVTCPECGIPAESGMCEEHEAEGDVYF